MVKIVKGKVLKTINVVLYPRVEPRGAGVCKGLHLDYGFLQTKYSLMRTYGIS